MNDSAYFVNRSGRSGKNWILLQKRYASVCALYDLVNMDDIFGWNGNYKILFDSQRFASCNIYYLNRYATTECLKQTSTLQLFTFTLYLYNELDEISCCFIFCDIWELFCVSMRQGYRNFEIQIGPLDRWRHRRHTNMSSTVPNSHENSSFSSKSVSEIIFLIQSNSNLL